METYAVCAIIFGVTMLACWLVTLYALKRAWERNDSYAEMCDEWEQMYAEATGQATTPTEKE